MKKITRIAKPVFAKAMTGKNELKKMPPIKARQR